MLNKLQLRRRKRMEV